MKNLIEVSVDSIRIHMPTAQHLVILKEKEADRYLPIWIGSFEAQAIATKISGNPLGRPLTHDLMKNILESVGADLSEITISELRDGTFYAKLSLDSQEIDARPSDAIALAVRFGVPIYVADKVMDEAAFLPEAEEQETPDAGGNPPKGKEVKMTKMEALRAHLKESIEREDYERAAQLRDEIRKLEQRH